MKYQITVHNAQGASEIFSADTRTAINQWLASWADPQNLTARVLQDGHEVASKVTGRKRLLWLYSK